MYFISYFMILNYKYIINFVLHFIKFHRKIICIKNNVFKNSKTHRKKPPIRIDENDGQLVNPFLREKILD